MYWFGENHLLQSHLSSPLKALAMVWNQKGNREMAKVCEDWAETRIDKLTRTRNWLIGCHNREQLFFFFF